MSLYFLTPERIFADQKQMVFGIPDPMVRVFSGLGFAVMGMMCISLPLILGPENLGDPDTMSPQVVQVLSMGLGLLFVLVGWLAAGAVDELRIDLTNRTYRRRKGTWPFIRRQSGTFDAFSHLSIEPEKRTISDAPWDVCVWMVRLVWKCPDRQPVNLFEHGVPLNEPAPDQLRDQLNQVALQMGLEVRERHLPLYPLPQGFLQSAREKIYGTPDVRLRDTKKAVVVLGLMTVGSLFVRVTTEGKWRIDGIIPVSGYVLWVSLVISLAGGLLWELFCPSGERIERTHSQMLVRIGLILGAVAICCVAPTLY